MAIGHSASADTETFLVEPEHPHLTESTATNLREESAKANKADDDKGAKEKIDVIRKQKPFGRNIVMSFKPYRILMMAFGRWPLTHSENPDGTFTYKLCWYHPTGIYFVTISLYFIYILLCGGYNLFSTVLYLTSNQSTFKTNSTREELSLFREGVLIHRHLVMVVSIWTNVFLAVITSVNMIYKSKYIANYFTFWTRACQTMCIDVAKDTIKYSRLVICGYLAVLTLLTLMALVQFGATTTGGPLLIAISTFKFFNPNLMTETGIDLDIGGRPGMFILYHILGGIGFLYLFVGSKIYILLFHFKCRLLRNGFASWNGRAYAAILKGGEFAQTEEGRTTFTLLFKDHCILMDLLESTNRVFAGVLETYFLLQISALCFELYVTLRTAKFGSNRTEATLQGYFVRDFDFIPNFLIFVTNLTIIYKVTKVAAFVGEEAFAGLEVIRRRTMIGRKTDEELYFMLSMYTNYISYRKIELSAGGYFYINKEFVITIVSTVFSYFIILFQFQPILDQRSPAEIKSMEQRAAIGKFLVHIENGRKCSWFANSHDEMAANASC